MSMTPEQFGKSVVAAGLLSADELKAVWNALPTDARPKDGAGFAKLLVRPGMITEFQAEQVLAGKGTSLVLGDYVMLSKIGAGGMGQVFKARHRRMKRIVAIKLLPAAVVKDAAAVKRFEREVEAAARLTHPNIVAALDARAEKGVHYLVMECVEGRDLSAVVKERGPLPVEEAVDYIRQAACGLAYAHSEGVVHRDIKPANLLLDKKGTVKILDMGLARFDESGDAADHQLTNTGQVMGTVDYMAPEQAQDTHAADARSDIYSLGCSLYRLLIGESVFHAETVVKKILAHMNAPIPSLVAKRPDVPADVDRIFQRMMAKQPEDRYQTMDEVVAALSPFAPGAASSTSVTSPGGATDTNLTSFLQSLGGAAATSRSQVLPSKTSVTPEQTLARVNPEVGTDPKSELSVKAESGKQKAAAASPVSRNAKRSASSRGKKPPLMWIAAGGGGLLALLLGVIVIVYGPDGEEVARVQVPEGGSATIVNNEPRPLGSGTTAPGTTLPLPNGRGSSQSPGSSGMSPLATLLLSSDYVWSEPENLGPNVNGPNNDYLISLTNDELRLFLHGNDAAGRHRYAEAVRNSPADAFGKLRSVSSISTDAFIGGDGLTAVAIIRDGLNTHDVMIQRRPKLGDAWDKGVNLGPQVNSPGNERLPTLSPDGLTLLFVTTREAKGVNQLWVSQRRSPAEPFGPATSVGPPVNSATTQVGNGVMLADGQTILFNRGGTLHIAFTGPNGGRSALELENHPFAPESSGPLNVWLSPDGRTAYFTADRPGGHGGKDIWVTRRVPKSGSAAPQQRAQPATSLPLAELLVSPDYVWSEPENLGTPVNSTSGESLPAISSDGLVLVFVASRAGGLGSSDLYITQRKRIDEPFVQPVNMGPTINSPSPDQSPWLSTDGCTLLYSTNRDGDAGNLYYATRTSQDAPFSPARPIEGEVNTSSGESGGALSGDGRILIYASTNRGNEDLWQATRDDPRGPFGNRVRLGNEVNSTLFERHPWLSADGRLLVFGTVPENTNDEKLKAADTETRIWMASRPDTTVPFGARKLLTVPVPFDGREQHPSLTADGRLLLYSSQRTADAIDHDIWVTRRVPKGASSPSPPATSDSPNTALKFDGDDLVAIPSLTFDPQGSYTLEAFITSPASADKGAGLAFGMPEQSYLSFTRLGDWRWVYSPKSRDHGTDIAIAGAPARPERTHVACVRTGQSHRLYVDGKLFSKTAEIPSPAQGTSPFQIGSEFRGIIDELRVSQVARYTADFTPATRFEPDADTLGLYHFDEAAGDVLKDSSGHNHHGQITGATWVKVDGTTVTQLGKAVADYALDPAANPDRTNPIVVELPRFLKASDPMTIEMFVTPRTHADAKQSRSLWSLAGRLELKQWADRWVWQHNHNDGTQRLEVISTPTGTLGQRVHLAAVSTGKEMRLFVNGQRAGTHVYAGTLPSVAGVPMSIANSPAETPGPGYVPFDGTIDDVRISMVARYDANFTPAASHELDADTAALYRCNEGTGDVLIDSSSHRRNGKVIGVRWTLDGGVPASNPQSAIPNPQLPGSPRTFPGHERVVREVAITPDGKCAVSVAWDNTWRRWDLETGTQMNKVPAHPSLTNCLSISPDGKLLVTGASDNHVKLWDLATGIEKRSYYVPKAGHFSTLAFTPDGQQFLSASSDGLVRLWGLEDAKAVREFSGVGSGVWDIVFLPGGEQFITVGQDKQVRFWNLKTGQQVTPLPERPTGLAAAVASPDGTLLVTACNGLVEFWNLTTRQLAWDWKFNNTSAGTLTYLPGGRYLVAGLQDKSIRIYDTVERKEVHKFQAPNAVMQHLAVTPDGRQIVSGGGYQVIDKLRPDDDFQLYIWDVPPQFVSRE